MIKDLFIQKIDREIETVIKADDQLHIDTEVREYVITKEISRKLSNLFTAYNESSIVNGVWISGFFGSGKSHLLKMLSYVIANKQLNDNNFASDIFAQKVDDNEILKADILRAAKTPAESILFNIDQQSNITSKSDANAILSVFYKVFYDHLGLYGSYTHVAEFELWLYKQGKYESFKTIFHEHTGKDWKVARRDYFDPEVTDAISRSLGKIFNKDASEYDDILDSIEEKQVHSIEDFCKKVLEYIQSKPKGFRLNFFVDEVGQYISDNTKLMLNLQTIVETLGTVTNANAWVFVTSQSDMESLVGDLTKTQKHDFSKILGRFRVQINLTSANIDEVIEKRLLAKKPEYKQELANIYNTEKSLLKSLISFSDTGVQFKDYQDAPDFVNKYPFVFYQFTLFQNCRIELANHNAFQGKHASVGERSMLSVFQQVLKEVEARDINALVTFDLMYQGIQNELRPEILKSIITAENNLTDPFALRVLKALFMVKYYNQFVTTKRNIAVLMIDNIYINLKEHEDQIGKALNILENQSYIQRNGDVYQFLTNEEKDIETEIKNTEIEESQVNNLLKELFFDEVIRDNKIRFLENKQDYEFSSKIDGIVVGRDKELEIEIITPNNQMLDQLDILKAQTMGAAALRFVTQYHNQFMDDVRMYLKVNKYNYQNQSVSNRIEVKRILNEKVLANNERKANLRKQADHMLGHSKAILNGTELDVAYKSSGKDYVIACFQNLVKIVYPSLRMLGNNAYSEDTFKRIISGVSIDEIFVGDDTSISEAENEILNIINRRKSQSDRTSIHDLKSHFNKRPYGWYNNAIFSILAKLYKKNKVEIRQGEKNLEDKEFISVLLNTAQHMGVYIDVQAVFDKHKVKNLKDVYADLFNQNTANNDGKDVARDFQTKLKELLQDVTNIINRKAEIPFVANLEEFRNDLQKLNGKDHAYIIDNISEYEDALLNAKERHYDPIRAFINGDQLRIYKEIVETVNGQTANISYVEGDEFQKLQNFLKEAAPYKDNILQKAKEIREKLMQKVLDLVKTERENAMAAFNNAIEALKANEFVQKLEGSDFSTIVQPLADGIQQLQSERFIGNIRSKLNELSRLNTEALNKAVRIATLVPASTEAGDESPDRNGTQESPQAYQALKYISRNEIKVNFEKEELITEADVKAYVKQLETVLLNQIQQNKRIKL